MSEPRPRSRWRKLGKLFLWFIVIGFVLSGALVWYTTTDSFSEIVERRLVDQMERVTGGRVEIGSFGFSPFRFRAEIRNLTIHGKEGPGEAPFVHVDHLIAQVKVISIFRAEFGFHSVVIEHPSVHIVSYADGTTNQPQPRLKAASDESPVEPLFALSINRLDVRHGVLLLNEQKLPLDFSVTDLALDMDYSVLARRYAGNALFTKVDTRYDGYRPIAWTAEAHFTLSRDTLDVTSLRATSHGARLEAQGKLLDLRQPRAELNYTLNVDLAQAAAVARRSEVRKGTLQASGKLLWSTQTFSSQGSLTIDSLDWRSPDLNLRNAGAKSQFVVTPDRIALAPLQARLLSGSASGDVEITNWLSENSTSARPREEQKGSVRLRISNISVTELQNALASASREFGNLALVGTADGTLQASWQGSPNRADTQAVVILSPPENVLPHQVPLTGNLRATYSGRSDLLTLQELNLSTRASQIQASGTLPSAAGLRVAAQSTDLGEWQPVLNALRGPGKIPVTLHGKASFEGTITGRLAEPLLEGNLRADNFETLVPATERTPEQPIHWDALAAHLQLSRRILAVRNGTLRHGASEISFDGSVQFQKGGFTPQCQFTARLDTRRTDVAELLALAGYKWPITGTMNLHLEASGTRAEPQADGRVEITDATAYGERVQNFNSRLHFSHDEIQFVGIDLAHDGARVTGDAAYNVSSQVFRSDLAGSNFDLAAIPRLHNDRFALQGRMDFTAKASGTLEEPSINGKVQLSNLLLNRTNIGDFALEATTQGADLQLTGRSQFEKASLTIDGKIRLRENWPAELSFKFDQLNADPLLQVYLKGRLNSHTTIAGDARLQGPLRDPRALKITGNLTQFQLDVEDLNFKNEGPVRFAVSNEVLAIDQFHLTGERTDLTATGTVHLTGDRSLDVKARGRVNLRLLESLNHELNSAGSASIDMAVNGTVSDPAAQGRLEFRNGSIAHIDLPSGLSEINGALVFRQNRLQIETLTARIGGGLVTFQGYATVSNKQLAFDVNASGEDVRLRYPPGISSTSNLELRFAGTSESSTVSGNLTMTRLSMTPGFDFASYLAATTKTTALAPADPALNRIRLDIHIVTAQELQMQTSIARLSGDADLNLRGTVGKPYLLGRADLTEGDIYFNGTKYRLERGDITFINTAGIKPVLDLQMSTRVRDYDINVRLNGEPSKLRLSYSAEPPLPEADIVALLALGRTREESARLQQSGSPLGQEASNVILTEALNAAVSNRVQRLFGGSRIKIDPQGLATETSPSRGPQITIEQQVANNLTLTYSTNVSQATQQIIQLEYNISRNLSIVGLRDQNGVVSFDVRIRRRKK